MRDGWIGNETLQNALQRADPRAGVVLEAVRTVNEDVFATNPEWATGSGTGITLLRDGGIKLTGNPIVRAEGAATQADNILTDLAIDDAFHTVRVEWTGGLAAVEARELDTLTIRVDPDVSGGGVEVQEWRAQLYRLAAIGDADPFRDIVLQPISAMVPVVHTGGTSQQDVEFDFLSAQLGGPVRVGGPPSWIGSGSPGAGDLRPRTYLFVWAVDATGGVAGNVAWMGDSASNSSSGSGYEARTVELFAGGDDPVVQLGTQYDEDAGSGTGMPWFELRDLTFSASTYSFTGSNGLDLGAAPTEDVEVVATGQLPAGATITYELAVPGSGTWVEVADGDIIGRDNTPDGGNDLSGLSVRQDYDARVTLTPPSSGVTSPVARRFGVRDRESTMLHEWASLSSYRQAIDPVDLHAEVGSADVRILKDGVTDYRDFFSEFFSENHIGKVEIRAWIGGRDLDRRYWLHLDDLLVDDTESRGSEGLIKAVNTLVLLRGIIPDASTSPREPLEYANQLISAVRSDIISNQLAIQDRRVGSGPVDIQIDSNGDGTEDTDALVTRRLEEADAKEELDALAFLSGGAEIASQGRIKVVQLHSRVDEDDAPHPVEVIPIEEASVESISPGYSERVDEFAVSWGWEENANEGRGKYIGDERAFWSAGFTKLVSSQAVRSGELPRLEDRISKWIPQSGTDGSGDPYSGLGRKVSTRQVQTLGVGMITVPVQSTVARPHLELGDVVAVETDRFVGKDPNTDRGVRGRAWLIGPVVWIDDPLGRNLGIWVRSYADILPSSNNVQRQSYVVPRVYSVQPSFSTTGVLSASVVARVPDSGSVKVAASDTSYPTETTVDAQAAQALDTEGSVQVGPLGTFQAGETAYVSVKAYENADGTGAESFEVFQVQVSRLPYVEPEITGDLTETETAGTGTFVVRDEALRVQAVEFQTKVGAGPWGGSWVSSWDSSTGTAGTDKNLERVEAVTKDEKHVTGIKARMTYLDADGVAREKFVVVTVDQQRIAEIVSASPSFDESGNVDVQVEGDNDVVAIYVTVGDGSAPADPTAATNDGSVASNSGLIQTSVSVTDGAVAIVKVVGENSENSLGPVRTYRSTRGDPIPTGAVAIDIADTGAASALAVGSSRVQSWKVAAAIGSAPSDATIRAATAIDKQSITQADVGTLVTAVPGERVYLGAFAYDQTGGGGRESARLDDTELYGVTNDGLDDRSVDSPKLALAGVERENLVLDIINDDYIQIIQESDTLANRVIAARHLFVGSFDNLIQNPGLEQDATDEAPHAFVGSGGSWSVSTSNPRSGARCAVYDPSGQTGNAFLHWMGVGSGSINDPENHWAATEGDQIYGECHTRAAASGDANQVTVRILFLDETGSHVGNTVGAAVTPTTSYQKVTHTATAPAGTVAVRVLTQIANDGHSNNIHVDDAYARRMVEGSIVVDGTITATHLQVNTLSAIAADLGTVTAGTVEANVIVASDSFTATNPVFTGSVDVEAGQGGIRAEILAFSGGRGAMFLRDEAATRSASWYVGASEVAFEATNAKDLALYATGGAMSFQPQGDLTLAPTGNGEVFITAGGTLGARVQITSGNGDISLDPGTGAVDFIKAEDGGPRSSTGSYLPIEVNGLTRYVLLYT